MRLQQAVNNVFSQLSASLKELTPKEYKEPCKTLFGNTIGQHVRHVIELFQCLEVGYESGVVNYENRKRDEQVEVNKDIATALLKMIPANLGRENKELLLEATYDVQSTESISIATNYFREIAYNLEHTIHHMALIRIGINEVSSIQLPQEFGVATSTVKYRNQCVQ